MVANGQANRRSPLTPKMPPTPERRGRLAASADQEQLDLAVARTMGGGQLVDEFFSPERPYPLNALMLGSQGAQLETGRGVLCFTPTT